MKRCLSLVVFVFTATMALAEDSFPKRADTFEVDGRPAFLYAAPQPAEGKPWLWYAPTLKGISLAGRKVYFEALMKAGISLAGYDLGEVRGAPGSTARFTKFYDEMVKRGWSEKPILLGQSRGGMMMLSWAVRNPEKLRAFVGIYPVLNLSSWPLQRSEAATLADFGMTRAELEQKLPELNPIEHLDGLLQNKVPVFIVHGDSDEVVPLKDNTAIFEERYRTGGGSIEVKVIPGEGHKVGPSFFECRELVDFVLAHGKES